MCICYYPDLQLSLVWSKRQGIWVEFDPARARTKIEPTRAYPAFPGAIVVPSNKEGYAGELVVGRWGLTPFWATEASFGKKNGYNARSETLLEKPLWREPFQKRRCIVPARGFYERNGGRWVRFSSKDGEPMPIAGLFEEPNKFSEQPTFALVTTEPNEVVSDVHDRMPVILSKEDMWRWLDPSAEMNELRALLAPSDPAGMDISDAGLIRRPGELKGALEPF